METNRFPYYEGMASNSYWKLRNQELLTGVLANAEAAEKYIVEINKNALEGFLKDYYGLMNKYVDNDGIVDVVKLQNAMRYDTAFVGKYRRLEKEIELFSAELPPKEVAAIYNSLSSTVGYVYNDIMNEFVKETSLETLNKKAIEEIVKRPFTPDSKEFSDRVWKNKEEMAHNLKAVLADGIATGKPIDKQARTFRDLMGSNTYCNQRIIRTETIACYGKASQQAYEDSGVVQWVQILDGNGHNSCDTCEEKDGEIIPLSLVQVGVNVPPFHPNCTGCIAPYFFD